MTYKSQLASHNKLSYTTNPFVTIFQIDLLQEYLGATLFLNIKLNK